MDRRQLLRGLAAGGGLASLTTLTAARASETPPAKGRSPVRRNFLDTEYGQIYYWTAGSSGPTIVLVHQSGNHSDEYLGLVPHLSEHCRLIAVDLPGHGRSDDPLNEPTVDDYASAVRNVLDHLDVASAHVVGHHGGALTAMSLAASEPHRFDRKVLSGTGGIKTAEETQKFVDSITRIDTTIRKDSEFIADAWERYVDMMSEGARVADIVTPFVAFLDARLKPYRGVLVNLAWDRRPALAKLAGPVLLVQGSLDQFVSGQESLLDIIPDSTRIELSGCGTFMFYDRPKTCAKLLRDYFQI